MCRRRCDGGVQVMGVALERSGWVFGGRWRCRCNMLCHYARRRVCGVGTFWTLHDVRLLPRIWRLEGWVRGHMKSFSVTGGD